MSTMTEERPIFENEEWLVTESGLEHKTTGYFIGRDGLADRREDGLWSWPLHMAEKSWCAMMPFAEAFSCAASVYNIKTGAELAQTFQIARCEVAPWPRHERQVFIPAPLMAHALKIPAANPIFIEPDSSENAPIAKASQQSDDPWRKRPQTSARPYPATARFRPSTLSPTRNSPFSWRAQREIRRTGTKLVRLIQAAWNIR